MKPKLKKENIHWITVFKSTSNSIVHHFAFRLMSWLNSFINSFPISFSPRSSVLNICVKKSISVSKKRKWIWFCCEDLKCDKWEMLFSLKKNQQKCGDNYLTNRKETGEGTFVLFVIEEKYFFSMCKNRMISIAFYKVIERGKIRF